MWLFVWLLLLLLCTCVQGTVVKREHSIYIFLFFGSSAAGVVPLLNCPPPPAGYSNSESKVEAEVSFAAMETNIRVE